DLAGYILNPASTRGTVFLTRAAKAHAFLEGRGYVTPQDVKQIGYDVLRHRLSVTYEAEAEDLTSEDLLKRIFDHLPVPLHCGAPQIRWHLAFVWSMLTRKALTRVFTEF